MNIWQIQQELLDIFNELEENGGELTEELEQQLAISQEDFRSKVESYTNVIKSVKADIAAIDQESKRLFELKKSKTALVDRLSKVIIEAVDRFGDTNKSGSKFFDYGTGKVSIRNTIKCETDDDKLKCMADEYAKCVSFENMLGNASNRENITMEEMIQRCKEHKNTNLDIIVDDPYDITKSDIELSSFDITIRVGMEDMLCGMGYKAIKDLVYAFGKDIVITPKVDKNRLKGIIANDPNFSDVTIGKIEPNQSLTIK